MKKIFLLITMGILPLIIFLIPSPVYAHKLYPSINEKILQPGSTTKHRITFENTTNKEIYIFPDVYSYNPQSNELIDKDSQIFIRADRDFFPVAPNSKLKLDYEIIIPNNLIPGTYFNLIILRQTNDTGLSLGGNIVGTTENMSQLVVMHITETSDVLGITTDFAQIEMRIIDKGIPFLRPTKVKYIYQNITNYVLEPDGEIQVYNNHGRYDPLYIKINMSKDKLFPNETIEETITIKGWHFSDLLYSRTIAGRFYNGIDENYILKEIQQNTSYILVTSGLFILILGFLLVKSIKQDRRKTKS
ncbi:MAG: hypothetical protein PHE21_00855 [Candidatus Dojkabacteria bacterium]|nr:hypothetical protein [Candidatus Dojkabacteria bacterium]